MEHAHYIFLKLTIKIKYCNGHVSKSMKKLRIAIYEKSIETNKTFRLKYFFISLKFTFH